jgi:cell division protein FtsW (lipid II flippase)
MGNRDYEYENNNGENKNNKNSGHMKHGLWMVVGCLVPILLIVGLSLLGIRTGRFSSLIFLLCPLLHVGMMVFMMKSGNGKSCHGSNESAQSSQE